jgi:hypothetical protein
MMREGDTPERGCHSNYLSNVSKKQILRVRCEKFGSYLSGLWQYIEGNAIQL